MDFLIKESDIQFYSNKKIFHLDLIKSTLK